MITRKVDQEDGLAGFTYNWIKKLANHVDKLHVICLEKGNAANLPQNVEVHSLGKEKGKNRLKEFVNFQRLAIKLVPKVDGVLAHQNPEYGILIAPWAKLFRKKLVAWYAHGSVSAKLKVLHSLVDRAITSTAQGFNLKSNKLTILHQGIDTELFAFKEKEEHEELRLLSVSRIGATKHIDLMIDLVKKLKDQRKVVLQIVGEATLEKDQEYLGGLKNQVRGGKLEEYVKFLGSVANYQTPALFQEADVFLNFSGTGSLDKAILEAMSCGALVLTSNDSAKDILPAGLIANQDNALDKLLALVDLTAEKQKVLRQELREEVVNNHSLDKLAKGIIQQF